MTAGATDIDIATPAQQATSPRLAVIALLAVCAVGGLLGIRTIVSEDLGYHLAYGERFWSDGEIVDHNAFLYTLPPTDTPPAFEPVRFDRFGLAGAFREDFHFGGSVAQNP